MWRATQKKVILSRISRFDLRRVRIMIGVIFGILGKFRIDIGEKYFENKLLKNIFSRPKLFREHFQKNSFSQIFNENFWKFPKIFKNFKKIRKFSIFEAKFWKFFEIFPKNKNCFRKIWKKFRFFFRENVLISIFF